MISTQYHDASGWEIYVYSFLVDGNISCKISDGKRVGSLDKEGDVEGMNEAT
jgi:hypothetical protein